MPFLYSSTGHDRRSVWTRFAVRVGQLVAWSSRTSRLGRGAIIGGRLTLALAPRALSQLSAGKTVVLVSGTNGKTTTTHLLTAMLSTQARVASNIEGANMPEGLVTALARDPSAPVAVLEVDESYLPQVIGSLAPAVVILLNLSRDQLDRVGEIRRVEMGIRVAMEQHSAAVIGNCDDPLVVSAAGDRADTQWVATGTRWLHDAAACPRCGGPIRREQERWFCPCGLARPEPDWILADDMVLGPGATRTRLQLALPGRINRVDAAMAIAGASRLGVPVSAAAVAVRNVRQVGGRYTVSRRGGRTVRLLLAKNPAGWSELLELLDDPAADLVLAINAREADGRDTSWLWDVPFEQLRGRMITASGERAADLAVRLLYADVAHRLVPALDDAVDASRAGPVDLVGNYTAFIEARRAFCDGR